MLPDLPPPPITRSRLWLAPYLLIGVFALAMLVITGVLQWRAHDTELSALEGDMHWAEQTLESRIRGHQDFLDDLGRKQEFLQLNYETFQVMAARYVQDHPEISAIAWVSTEGKVEWVAPNESNVVFVGEQLAGVRYAALQEALRVHYDVFSGTYPDHYQQPAHDLITPVQRGSADLGAFVAMQSLEALLRTSFPSGFTSRYSLTVRDPDGHEIYTNSSIRPADRRVAGAVTIDALNSRLGLSMVAYRGSTRWVTYVPIALIVVLTLIASVTLVQLRRHAIERARTEEELRSAYAFRLAMSNSLIIGIRAIDLEGRITFVNKAFCRMTGFSEAELVGCKPPYPYWPPEEFPHLEATIESALTGRIPAGGFEMRIMRKSGERFDVRLYFSPLVQTDGKQIGWMASINDITEPKRARMELERAHERFATVLEGLDVAVHVADADSGDILFANRAFQSIFGFDTLGKDSAAVTAACRPPDEWLQRDPHTLAPEDLPCELFDGEMRHSLSGHWYHLHERAIRWVDGRTVRVQIAGDITDKKRIEEVNQEQQKRLEQTSRLITMGEMASSLAHELNQPLSAIANYCAGCIKRMQTDNYRLDDLLSAMQKAAEQAERAGKIIRRMRDMVKKGEPRRVPVHLQDLVDEARAFADIEARKTGALIEVDIPGDAPRIVVDRIMIEQVLLNLIKNGVEAMAEVPPPQRRLAIHARTTGDGMLEVRIADRGHGLAEEDRERIFAPFFTTKPEGMGIGLAICRSIIEFHQGHLWVESGRDGGTVFLFTVPVEDSGEARDD